MNIQFLDSFRVAGHSRGRMHWCVGNYVLQNGQYVQQSKAVFNNLANGGSPLPKHPCW